MSGRARLKVIITSNISVTQGISDVTVAMDTLHRKEASMNLSQKLDTRRCWNHRNGSEDRRHYGTDLAELTTATLVLDFKGTSTRSNEQKYATIAPMLFMLKKESLISNQHPVSNLVTGPRSILEASGNVPSQFRAFGQS